MNLPLELALAATGAQLVEGERAPAIVRPSTDTRTLERGDTFVALRGERFDGHAFVAEAVRRGAAMLVLDDAGARIAGTPAMIVDSTISAYMALAGAARGLYRGTVVGITGSAGKTTTKALLTQLLAAQYGQRVLTAPENENNEIGVSKLLLAVSNDAHDVVVAELGARHYGDVAALVEIARPQIGILTNVGEAHLEIMGSRERLEETKWGLFASGAAAVLNAGDEVSRRRAPSLDRPPRWFAAARDSLEAYARLDPFTGVLDGRVLDRTAGTCVELAIDVRLPGLHNRANLAAALAAALELGVPLERLAGAIPSLELPRGRFDRIAVSGGLQLIYDAYNANASGMMAALDAFSAESGARRIAVLASMAELGDEAQALHERVGAHAAARVDVLLVSGDYAHELARGAQRAGLGPRQIVEVSDNAQAASWLRRHVGPDDVVLLKGSRKYKLEEIVEELRA